jgi:hypothetical protein
MYLPVPDSSTKPDEPSGYRVIALQPPSETNAAREDDRRADHKDPIVLCAGRRIVLMVFEGRRG